MLSPEIKRNIYRIIPFGLIWLFFSIVYSMLEWGLIGSLTRYPSTGNPYHFTGTLFVTAGVALISGLLTGAIEILYLSKLFLQKSFAKKIVYKTLLYVVIIILFLLTTTAIYNSIDINTSIFSRLVWNNVWAFFLSYSFLSIEVYIASIIVISLFYTEVSENLGQGILANFSPENTIHRLKRKEFLCF